MSNLSNRSLIVTVAFVLIAAAAALPTSTFTSALQNAKAQLKDGGKLWAVLIAGSNGYSNYRHQADVCHAYQILHAHGVSDENIIVMMYDDIAHNMRNPDKGIIINEPNGPNVYPGVPKDYTKGDVKPQVFLDVLSGNAAGVSGTGSGRVVQSTANDHIFVYFADHGAPGLIAFPTHYLIIPQSLSANKFMDTLKGMHSNNQYNKMVIYIEACESGSMFAGLLPTDMNIYAVTAATPHESSYACYHDDHLGTYLGDCFSNHWMENTDNATADGDFSSESLMSQFNAVSQDTTTSTVCHYGDLSIANANTLANFLGTGAVKVAATKEQRKAHTLEEKSPVSSRDVELAILKRALASPKSASHAAWASSKLEALSARRAALADVVASIVKEAGSNVQAAYKVADDNDCGSSATVEQLECTDKAFHSFAVSCGGVDESVYSHIRALHHLCGVVSEEKVLSTIQSECVKATLPAPFRLFDEE